MSEVFAADISAAEFDRAVVEASRERLVVVDFWAPWCGPCRMLKPLLEKLAQEYAGRFFLAKVNADENQALCVKYSVRGIPSVKAFFDGGVVDEFSGAMSETYVRDFLKRNIPSAGDRLVRQAHDLVNQGRWDDAVKKLDDALAVENDNAKARVLKAGLLLDRNDIDGAGALLDGLTGEILDYEHTQNLLSRLSLARQARELPDKADLEGRIAADPMALDARLQLAARLAAANDFSGALHQLIEVHRRDSKFQDGAARKRMVEIFDLLGPESELVAQYRRQLASLLH